MFRDFAELVALIVREALLIVKELFVWPPQV